MNDFDRITPDSPERPEGKRPEEELLYHKLTRAIIGGFWAVKTQLGPGFLEKVYANALAVQLRAMGLKVEREVPFEIVFLGVRVGWYRADLLVESKVIIETKVTRHVPEEVRETLLNYLTASSLDVGLILNFAGKGEVKRVFGIRQGRAV